MPVLKKIPRVSVVVPVRNSEKYLKEALDSILQQSFTDFELLIVDDNSSDNTITIIRTYEDTRIRVMPGPGKGLAAALNFAIGEARGEFIARMDADDIAHTSRLGKQVAFMDEHPDVGVCGTCFQQFMGGDAVHKHMENVCYADLMMGCYIGHPTAMFRRELFAKENLFYNELMRFSEDYDLWSRAIRVTKLANVPEILLQYRRHEESASVTHVGEMHELDVGVKLRMVEYLVGSLAPPDSELLIQIFKHQAVNEAARIELLMRLMDSIRHRELCSPLELLSIFHQMKPLAKADMQRITRPIVREMPIFVISYNHLSYIQASVAFFENAGFKNIHIIDNASTYPPLVEYLRSSPHHVHYMGKNYKHMVLFDSQKFAETIDSNYFVLTDPDVLPIDECPANFLYLFLNVLLGNPTKNKVGFSLKLDDLPDHYELKENVIKWESRFYDKISQYAGATIYDAPIDTTFALYRPRKEWRTSDFFAAFRVGAPYAARHLPWYRDLSKLSDEELFYRSLDQGSSNWNGTMTSDQLHKKYGTGQATEMAEKQSVPTHLSAEPGGFIGKTFRRRRVGDLRGYFINGQWPLLNLHTVPRQCICTTLYAFGRLPLVSKTTSENRHVYRALGIVPFWLKTF